MTSTRDARGRQSKIRGPAHRQRWLLGAALWSIATAGLTAGRVSAISALQEIRKSLTQDESQGNWRAFREDARQQWALLNGSPRSSLKLARAALQLGAEKDAMREVDRVLNMGYADRTLESPPFLPFADHIADRLAHNRSAASSATVAIRLADPDVLPEDIDYDTAGRRFLITSVLQRRILTVDQSASQSTLAESPDHWPMMAIKIDARRRVVWATEVALTKFRDIPPADWGRSALLEFDLQSGALLARYEGPGRVGWGDLALAADGDPIISDGDGGGLYRLHHRRLVRIDHGEFISPQTVAVCPDGVHVFVPDYLRGIAAFNLAGGAIRWLSMSGRFALDGIDGLYCRGRTLFAVQNGTAPERVIAFRLDPNYSSVISEAVIERATNTLGDPTHGVLVGSSFFYIANSGWDRLDEHGETIASAQASPAIVMRSEVLEP